MKRTSKPVLNENGEWRSGVVHRMTRRLETWDYTEPCIYSITVILANRKCKVFGEVFVDQLNDDGVPVAAHCELSSLGRAVADEWEGIPRYYPQIKILGEQVMPDHFHGVLWVKEKLPCHLGHVIKGFKLGCNRAARNLGIALAPEAGLFAEGFQDTILFREGQLKKMINYVKTNPLRLAVKRARRDLFKVVRDIGVRLATGEAAMESPPTIHGSADGDGLGVPSPPISSAGAVGHFSAIGNHHLLELPFAQVQCSRRFFAYKRVPKRGGGLKIAKVSSGEPIVERTTPEYEAKRGELFAAARHGAVLLSPCISDGERQIAREALAAKFPLVVMRNKGFSPLHKPPGRYFDACAEGRLLMLAPATWEWTPVEKPMTRIDATAMNRLCQWIAGDDAAEIDYHGMTPTNIDALALAAVLLLRGNGGK